MVGAQAGSVISLMAQKRRSDTKRSNVSPPVPKTIAPRDATRLAACAQVMVTVDGRGWAAAPAEIMMTLAARQPTRICKSRLRTTFRPRFPSGSKDQGKLESLLHRLRGSFSEARSRLPLSLG